MTESGDDERFVRAVREQLLEALSARIYSYDTWPHLFSLAASIAQDVGRLVPTHQRPPLPPAPAPAETKRRRGQIQPAAPAAAATSRDVDEATRLERLALVLATLDQLVRDGAVRVSHPNVTGVLLFNLRSAGVCLLHLLAACHTVSSSPRAAAAGSAVADAGRGTSSRPGGEYARVESKGDETEVATLAAAGTPSVVAEDASAFMELHLDPAPASRALLLAQAQFLAARFLEKRALLPATPETRALLVQAICTAARIRRLPESSGDLEAAVTAAVELVCELVDPSVGAGPAQGRASDVALGLGRTSIKKAGAPSSSASACCVIM